MKENKNIKSQGHTASRCSDLLGVLGVTSPARDLTAKKTASILKDKDFGEQISGFVLTDKGGGICIVDKSAVRWLRQSEMWWLMHESNELPPSTPNEKADLPPTGARGLK